MWPQRVKMAFIVDIILLILKRTKSKHSILEIEKCSIGIVLGQNYLLMDGLCVFYISGYYFSDFQRLRPPLTACPALSKLTRISALTENGYKILFFENSPPRINQARRADSQ